MVTQTRNQGQSPASCANLASLLPVELFKALADPTRVTMLAGLATGGGSQTVSQIADCCPVDVSVVSRHLKTLARAGILESEKRGKQVHYRVRIPHLVGLLRGLADALETCCPDDPPTITDPGDSA